MTFLAIYNSEVYCIGHGGRWPTIGGCYMGVHIYYCIGHGGCYMGVNILHGSTYIIVQDMVGVTWSTYIALEFNILYRTWWVLHGSK